MGKLRMLSEHADAVLQRKVTDEFAIGEREWGRDEIKEVISVLLHGPKMWFQVFGAGLMGIHAPANAEAVHGPV